MKLPERVRIGPYDYAVQLEDKVLGDQNQDLYGRIRYGPQQINLERGLSAERTLAVFLHEVLHGVDEYMSIGLTEKQVTRLGVGLATFLRDNNLLREDDPLPPIEASQGVG